MSFFKRLFGGAPKSAEPETLPTLAHEGYLIRATPFVDGGQHQLSGIIEKAFDGETKSHRFVRADRFVAREDAVEAVFLKGKLLIREQGDRIFG